MPVTVLLAAGDGTCPEGLDAVMSELGLSVRRTDSAEVALRIHDRISPALVMVSSGLDDIHGFDLCRRIRRGSDVPLIVLASNANECDRVLALELGADDVISEDCGAEELQERVRAALRRGPDLPPGGEESQVLDFGRIIIDRSGKRVIVDGECRDLTPMESELLWALGRHAGEVVKSRHLLETVWGYPRGVRTRTLDVHVGRVRRKLGENGRAPRHIITVRSVGYRFEPDPSGPDTGEIAV